MAKGPSTHAGRALAVAILGVVITFGALGLGAIALSHRNSDQVGLGDQTFGGSTSRFAGAIAQRGPLLFSDVSGHKDRDLLVQHLGPKVDQGWYAFLAGVPGKPRDCTWEWQAAKHQFRAKCDHRLTAPADGHGLTRFPVTVSKGHFDIDLNAAQRKATTTTTSTTSTTEPIKISGSH
ncbi:MAG TPA: hypothetical protein VGM93_06405 [Acidimicrobiales bacterium]